MTQDIRLQHLCCSRASDDHANAADMDGKLRIASCGVELCRNKVRTSNEPIRCKRTSQIEVRYENERK